MKDEVQSETLVQLVMLLNLAIKNIKNVEFYNNRENEEKEEHKELCGSRRTFTVHKPHMGYIYIVYVDLNFLLNKSLCLI